MKGSDGSPVNGQPGPRPPGSARVNSALLDRLAKGAAVAAGKERLLVETPFSGTALGSVPRATAGDMKAACERARTAQLQWALTPLSERAELFLRYHDLLLADNEEILDLIQLEIGKSRVHAYIEVLDSAVTARYYAHTAKDFLRARRRQGALPGLTSTQELHHPRGVVGFITPWNFPLILGINDAIPALVAGNACVVKPDSRSPFTALWAAAKLTEAGLPAGVLQVVPGPGSELGPALVDSVDYLMFTGSTATGRGLAQAAAARLIDCSMELGGKNAALVLDDAPADHAIGRARFGVSAVDGLAFAISAHAGQVCTSCERLYVQDGIYDQFVPALATTLNHLRLGNDLSWDYDVGSLSSADQLSKVSSQVDEAVARGARVLAGGHPRPDLGPYFYEPTLLEGVTEDMTLCREETFGPVASVYRFHDLDEAIASINDSQLGLSASVWTRDLRRGSEIAARIEVGNVGINDGYMASWASVDSPMGGYKESGIGRRHGEQGILKYTESQTVAVQRFNPVDRIPMVKHRGYAAIMTAALRLLKRLPAVK